MKIINVINKIHSTERFIGDYYRDGMKILNIGSSITRYGNDCVNIDIQKKINVDIISDAHELPFQDNSFDIVILTAVLQLCENPYRVADEIRRVLKCNGHIYIDAPFVQPYCRDMPDLFRFTRDGLMLVFKKFSVIECNVSIPGGSSLAFYCQNLVDVFENKYVNYICRTVISIIVLPFSLINFNKHNEVAGAFYLIAKKT